MKANLWNLFELSELQSIDGMEVESVERGRSGSDEPWVVEARDIDDCVYRFADQEVEFSDGTCVVTSLPDPDDEDDDGGLEYRIVFKTVRLLTVGEIQ